MDLMNPIHPIDPIHPINPMNPIQRRDLDQTIRQEIPRNPQGCSRPSPAHGASPTPPTTSPPLPTPTSTSPHHLNLFQFQSNIPAPSQPRSTTHPPTHPTTPLPPTPLPQILSPLHRRIQLKQSMLHSSHPTGTDGMAPLSPPATGLNEPAAAPPSLPPVPIPAHDAISFRRRRKMVDVNQVISASVCK